MKNLFKRRTLSEVSAEFAKKIPPPPKNTIERKREMKEQLLAIIKEATILKQEDISSLRLNGSISSTKEEREYWNGVVDGLTEAYNLIENFKTKENGNRKIN